MRQLFSSIPGQVLDFIAALMCIALLFRKQVYKFADSIMKQVFDKNLVEKPSE